VIAVPGAIAASFSIIGKEKPSVNPPLSPSTFSDCGTRSSRIISLMSEEQGVIMSENGLSEIGTKTKPLIASKNRGVDIDVRVQTCGTNKMRIFDHDYKPSGGYKLVDGGLLEPNDDRVVPDEFVGRDDGVGLRQYEIVLVEMTDSCEELLLKKKETDTDDPSFFEEQEFSQCPIVNRSSEFFIEIHDSVQPK
jgi:hypothetical protein